MSRITVEQYNPEWKTEFEKAKLFYARIFQGMDLEIVHIGSTSIEGLWAKPILDIDIIVKSEDDSKTAIKRLADYGYTHLGDMGVKGREAFRYDGNNTNITWMRHNLYVCLEGNENLKNHLLLQRHLRNNQDAVEIYGSLKRQLAIQFPDDIDSYVDGKTELILSFLEAEGMKSEVLNNIEAINRKE